MRVHVRPETLAHFSIALNPHFLLGEPFKFRSHFYNTLHPTNPQVLYNAIRVKGAEGCLSKNLTPRVLGDGIPWATIKKTLDRMVKNKLIKRLSVSSMWYNIFFSIFHICILDIVYRPRLCFSNIWVWIVYYFCLFKKCKLPLDLYISLQKCIITLCKPTLRLW